MTQLSHSSSSIPLAFLGFGVRTSKILFVLFGVGLVFNLLTKKNATEKDAPNWSHVVTSPEQEAELHAFSCRDCGYTIFPARGREGKFFPDSFKCPTCGAPKEAFFDARDDVLEDVGDELDEYEYENMDDYVGGDEALEKAGGGVGVIEMQAEAPPSASVPAPAPAPAPTPAPVPAPSPAPASSPPKSDGDDLDVLGMDF